MAVEILILSGSRQGERLVFEAGQFRAGDDPACEVFFDPQNDPSARDRRALFRLADDGWYVERIGPGEIYINQEPVVGKTRIRSGDVVRMSERGPDFSFGIVTRATASSHDSGGAAVAPLPLGADVSVPEAKAEPPPEPPSAPRTEPSIQPAPTPEPAATPQPVSATQPASGPPSVAAAEPWRHAFWAVVGLAVCVLILVPVLLLTVVRLILPGGPPAAPPAQTVPVIPSPKPEPAEPRPEPEQSSPPPEKPDEPAEEARDAWLEVSEQLRDAVFFVQVQVGRDSDENFLPYATCCAISEDTLLTSAQQACYLAKWRQQEGWKVWAKIPAKGIKEEVQEIRVHRVFAKAAREESDDWIFMNLGLLRVGGRLPKIAPLASSEELSRLRAGREVACFGFTFEEVDKILDVFEPQLARGKIYHPTLFQLKAKIPPNAHGSPIINAQGKILGVYGTAVPPDRTPVKDLHYATAVDPDSIHAWLEKRDTEIWVDPPIPEVPSGP